jgi:hypothetical protein
MVRAVALALLVTTSSCTVAGTAVGTGLGYAMDNTGKGALYGAVIGLMCDMQWIKMFRALGLR